MFILLTVKYRYCISRSVVEITGIKFGFCVAFDTILDEPDIRCPAPPDGWISGTGHPYPDLRLDGYYPAG
jgi:hypothetical protein